MKIKLNELRTLIRKVAAMQIAEAATKRKPVAKNTKKISVNEIRSMIKEAILKEAKQTRELKTTEQVKKEVVDEINQKYPTFVKLFNEKKLGFSLEDLIDKLYSPMKNKEDIKKVSSEFPSLQFLSVKALKDSLRKWIPGAEKLEISSVTDTEETEKRPEPVYQTGEETLQNIADKLEVTKQAVDKIVKDAEQNFYNIVGLLSANKKIKDEEISKDLKTIKKANLRLRLKKSLVDAVAEVAKIVTEKVLDKAENFIDEFNTKIEQNIDFSNEDYDSLSEEEQIQINKQIKKWFADNNIINPTENEYSFMIDLLNYNELEENKKMLSQLFFNVDEFEKWNSTLARIARMFHDTIRPEISDPFNPETRGRGGVDPIILQKLKDSGLLDDLGTEV